MSRALETLAQGIRERAFVRYSEEQPIVGGDGTRPLPWLFDFRAILCESEYLEAYADLFWERFKDHAPFQVCGMETTGIALVAAIVLKAKEHGKSVPGLYVRKSRKKTGLLKAVEGTVAHLPIVLIDDLINSGGSAKKAILALRDEGLTVQDVFTILSLRSPEAYAFPDGARFQTLFTADTFGVPLAKGRGSTRDDPFTVHWKFASPNPNLRNVVPKSSPVLDETRVYMGSDSGGMWALNQKDGAVAWQFHVGFAPYRKNVFSTPAMHKGTLYFGAYDGNVYALNAETGTERWIYRDADWVGSSPALAPDIGLLFIGLEYGLFRKRGGIAALSLKTGEEQWVMRSMPRYTHCAPLYVAREKSVFIGSNDGVIYCFNAKTGTLKWTYQTGGDVKVSLAYDATKRRVVVGSFDKHIHAINAVSGQRAWTFATSEPVFSTPLVHGGMIFASSLDKRLYAIDPDGKEVWRRQTDGRIFASPIFAEGMIWIGSNDGQLREIDPKTGERVSSLQLSERITNPIAYNAATKRFFVPTQANELYCVSRKSP